VQSSGRRPAPACSGGRDCFGVARGEGRFVHRSAEPIAVRGKTDQKKDKTTRKTSANLPPQKKKKRNHIREVTLEYRGKTFSRQKKSLPKKSTRSLQRGRQRKKSSRIYVCPKRKKDVDSNPDQREERAAAHPKEKETYVRLTKDQNKGAK